MQHVSKSLYENLVQLAHSLIIIRVCIAGNFIPRDRFSNPLPRDNKISSLRMTNPSRLLLRECPYTALNRDVLGWISQYVPLSAVYGPIIVQESLKQYYITETRTQLFRCDLSTTHVEAAPHWSHHTTVDSGHIFVRTFLPRRSTSSCSLSMQQARIL